MVQLIDREGDTFSLEVTNGIATCLIHDELPEYLLNGLINFIHDCYSPLAVVVNIADSDHHFYYISQSKLCFDFEWAVKNLNEMEPGGWLQKSPTYIWGDTYLRIGAIVQTLQASKLPADEPKVAQVQISDVQQFLLPGWLRTVVVGAIGFGLGALFGGII